MDIYFTLTQNSLPQYIVFAYFFFVSMVLISIIMARGIEEGITQGINMEPVKSFSDVSTQTPHEVKTSETQTQSSTQKHMSTQTSYNHDADQIDIVDNIY